MIKLLKKIITLVLIIAIGLCAFTVYEGYNIYKEVTEQTPIEEKVKEIKAQRHYTRYEDLSKTYIDAVIAAVSDEKNIVEKERKIDKVREEQAWELASFDFFNINFILSYLVRVNIIARWMLLLPEAGREMLNRLMRDLDAKELVKKQ